MQTMNLETLAEESPSSKSFPLLLNPELYTFKGEDSVFVYSPIVNTAAVISEKEHRFIQDNRIVNSIDGSDDYNALLKSFVYMDAQELDAYKKKKVDGFEKIGKKDVNKVVGLTLMMSSVCNLKCTYCFVFGGEPELLAGNRNLNRMPDAELDPEMAIQIIKEVKPKNLHFFAWGEPTVAFDKIRCIVESIPKGKITMDITTNGVFAKRKAEIVKFLVENKIFIDLSYDGLPWLNDKYRVFANGAPTAVEILNTVNEIKKYGSLEDFAMATIVVGPGAETHITDMAKHLQELGFSEAYIEPAKPVGRAKSALKTNVDLEIFARELAEATVYSKHNGFNLMCHMLPSAFGRVPQDYLCRCVSGNRFTLGLDGNVYACLDPLQELKIGKINKNEGRYSLDIDENKVRKIMKERYAPSLKECSACPVKCGGGCTKHSFETHSKMDVGGESDQYCDSRRLALFEYVKKLFEITTLKNLTLER